MDLQHLIEAQQLSPDFLFSIFSEADDIRKNQSNYSEKLKNKILATLFYEPSTRTRLSFESAMLKLGGGVLSTENAREFSSAVKGESIEDTIRVISGYADAAVIRHYEEGTATRASQVSKIPIINAGDGKGQHPTQALLDVYTIYRELGKLEGINITLIGDLASGRTARSLCYLLGKFKNNHINFISPPNLRMGQDIRDYLERHNVQFSEENNLRKTLPSSDIVYMTRIQKERISAEDYEKAKGRYIIKEQELELMKPGARLMHPLPNAGEIMLPIGVENNDSRVAYFRQSENGLYARMALLLKLIS